MDCGESARPLESVKSDRSAVSTEQDNFERLKDGASEGFPLSLKMFCKLYVRGIVHRWDFGCMVDSMC